MAFARTIDNCRLSYTSEGRGNGLTYTITDIPDRFRVLCVFDLGFSPQTNFTKLRDFIFYLLGNDDFSWRPMEMMEEYLRIEKVPISRQTISKYIRYLEKMNLIASGDYVYYRVYKYYGEQRHEIITKEAYSMAWKLYWDKRKQGHDSRVAYSVMYNAFEGVPRKQRRIEQNGLYNDTLSLLSELVAESYMSEIGG